jgi:hypothetical protein
MEAIADERVSAVGATAAMLSTRASTACNEVTGLVVAATGSGAPTKPLTPLHSDNEKRQENGMCTILIVVFMDATFLFVAFLLETLFCATSRFL